MRTLPSIEGRPARKLLYVDDSTGFVTESDLNIMHVIFRDHGYEKASSVTDAWSVFWHAGLLKDHELSLLGRMAPHQRLNKLPGASALTLKSNLWVGFERMVKLHGKDHFGFMPDSFVLPRQSADYEKLLHEEADAGNGDVWILKPENRQRGAGIFLHRAVPDSMWGVRRGGVFPHEVAKHIGVACRYVDPPMCLDNLKFDIRLYVLVSSVHPLVVYVFEEGLCRFATEPYDISKIDRRCMHLTNYSINKKSKTFVKNEDEEHDGVGSKWSLSALRRRLMDEFGEGAAKRMWEEVDDVIAKAVCAAEPTLFAQLAEHLPIAATEPVRTCFQLFGFDVMFDGHKKPWLLEVNCDPALGTEAPVDLKVKSTMLVDAFNVVGMPVAPEEPPPPPRKAGRGSRASGAATAANEGAAAPDGNGAAAAAMRERWVQAVAPNVRDRTEQIARWTRHLVDSEFERSKGGQWRRLIPSPEGKYLPFLSEERALNRLPFQM